MLSRIAESLFWIGRYIERAEDTARFLDVHLRLLVEDPWKSEDDACRDLLSLMGLQVDHPDREMLVQLLAHDTTSTASIASSWGAARDNARRAREVIPSEVWEVINTTWHQLPARRRGGHTAFCNWARERSALLMGTARSAMVHDEGYQFFILGRHLEQADMTARLVSAATLVGTNPWPAVLRGCGAHDAFLRTYRGVQAGREAAEFLIQDDRFPRSVMYGLVGATNSLELITPLLGGSGPGRTEARDTLYQLGRLRARLTYTPMTDLLDNLAEYMVEVQEGCDLVTKIISGSFFSVTDTTTSWVTEGVG
ncbi:alpha-E domain-containing protein [Propionibacteriaceae bacterium Y2011]|uniref:alpha-E domain-containing protein n=1 Tax=Microlunatus sp. Y2014 TaxID=3418488 RepID=UPI003B47C2F8